MAGNKPRVVIVGAGMAGLAAAAALHAGAGDLFELRVVEGGDRIGGRVRSAVYGGATVELGATWIHGIGGSPLYKIAEEIGALSSETPCESVDLQPSDAVTVGEDGGHVDPSLVRHVSLIFDSLMRYAEGKPLAEHDDLPDLRRLCSGAAVFSGEDESLGAFLRRGFQAYLDAAAHGGARRLAEEAVFRMQENIQRSHTSAEDLTCVDYKAESQYKMYPGDEINIAKGYSSIIEHLASSLPPGMVQMGLRVEEIQWLPGEEEVGCRRGRGAPVRLGFRDGTVMFADHVVVTVSLGVLKEGICGGFFNPGLPRFKEEAISRLGFGVVDKLFAEMDSGRSESLCVESPARESDGEESTVRESFVAGTFVMESRVKERESFLMEPEGRESFLMESQGRESFLMESLFKERESFLMESPVKKRQSFLMESPIKERESFLMESPIKERESFLMESLVKGRESFLIQSEGRESFLIESLPVKERESVLMESEGRESFVKESEDRESFVMESRGSFRTLNMVFYPEGSGRCQEEIPRWIRRSFSVSPVNRESNVLVSWFVGKEAIELEDIGEEEIKRGLERTLCTFLGKGGYRVRGVLRSRWGSDPLFLGSYSFVAVGSSTDDLDALAEPLPVAGCSGPPLQVLFAGEATHRTHYSTTHGAYLSGLREAWRLLEHYKCGGLRSTIF